MAKLELFWHSKVDFLFPEKAGQAYYDWYLEALKKENNRVTSLQEINKKLLENISELKEVASTDSAWSHV